MKKNFNYPLKQPNNYEELTKLHCQLASYTYKTNKNEWNGFPPRSVRIANVSCWINEMQLTIVDNKEDDENIIAVDFKEIEELIK